MPELVLDVDFEGGYEHGVLLRAEVREGFGKHQIAILDFPVPNNPLRPLAPEETPVTFQWGRLPKDIRTFYGYVAYHETNNLDNEHVLRFYLIGTSRPLNDPVPTSWKNVTASYVARQIGERHGLRVILHNSKTVLPYVTPGQDSDLSLLNRLADQAGFKCWVDGGTLYFIDPLDSIKSPARSIASEYDFDLLQTDTVFGVRTASGSQVPSRSAATAQRVFGLDYDAASLIQSSSSRFSADLGIDVPTNTSLYPRAVSSLSEAHRIAERAATSGVWESIEATTRGDGRARVGALVDLEGQALNEIYKGVWMAANIIHVLSTNPETTQWGYSTQIDLIRNQKGSLLINSYSTLKDTYSEVSSVLRNGQWESSILEAVYV